MYKLSKMKQNAIKSSCKQKKVFGLVLAVIMVLSIFSAGALAADSVVWLTENYSWLSSEVFTDGLMRVHDLSAGEGMIDSNTRYGFIDVTGKVIIPMIYDHANAFSEGLAVVGKGGYSDGKYGFIDKTGKEVAPLIYDYCYDFKEGLAAVRKGDYFTGKYGFVDKTGKVVIPLIYNNVSDFKDGIAAVTNENDEIAFIDKTGKLLVQTEYTDYDGYNIQQFNEGLCPVYAYNEGELKYGFIDTTGKLVIDTIFSDYGMIMNPYRFDNGVSMVFMFGEDEAYIKYIDKTGKFVPEPKEYSTGVVVKYDENKSEYGMHVYGFVDETGKVVIPFIYDYISSFTDGIASAVKDDKCGVIDKTGKEVVPFVYDHISGYSEGVIFVRKDGKVGIIKNILGGKPVVATVTAKPTSSKVLVNGNYVTFEAYNINGNNYFKLRDLAMALKGTNKQFEVTWDGEKNAINLISNKSYTSVGGELTISGTPANKTATTTTSQIFVDGKRADFTAYNIGGNNYFKLRDVMKVFDVGVGWNGATNTISIDTSVGYSE